jgi:hypothetical protein
MPRRGSHGNCGVRTIVMVIEVFGFSGGLLETHMLSMCGQFEGKEQLRIICVLSFSQFSQCDVRISIGSHCTKLNLECEVPQFGLEISQHHPY